MIVAALLTVTLAEPVWTGESQGPAPAESEAFDTVSIRERPRSSTARRIIRLGPSSFSFTDGTALDLIQYAFQIPEVQVVGDLPKWARSTRFDVVAKSTGPPLTRSRLLAMAKRLLQDRFRLNASSDQVTMPAYALIMARSDGAKGPDLRPSRVACEADPPFSAAAEKRGRERIGTAEPCGLRITTNGGALVQILGGRVTMEQFAADLSRSGGFDRPVLNRTGLNGEFDVLVRVTPDMPGWSTEGRLLIAMREQLGMTLRGEQLPIDVLRIHRIERPSEN